MIPRPRCSIIPTAGRQVLVGATVALFATVGSVVATATPSAAAVSKAVPPPFPGPAISRTSAGPLSLSNNTLVATFSREGGKPRMVGLASPLNGLDLPWNDPNLFTLHLAGGSTVLASSAMDCAADPSSLRATFTDPATGLRVDWRAVMPDGANYLRQEVVVHATTRPVAIDRIEMLRGILPGVRVSGPYDGLPLVTDQLFLGIEHPMARNALRTRDGWTPEDLRARVILVPVTGIAGAELTARFDYQRGNHRIDVAGVELLDALGKPLASDMHAGFSGHAASANTYRLAVPAGVTAGTLRVTLGGKAGETDSWGKITVTGGSVTAGTAVSCGLPRVSELKPGETWSLACAVGVYPKGQLRRAFLYYLERERAHPYRQYWHYNSWYDLNIGNNDNPDPLKRMTEEQCLEVVRAFGSELHEKRGIGLDGFVWDDGWDDWNSLWGFHRGFPHGFSKLKVAAAKQGAGMGAWLSPWGGYGQSHDLRVKFGRDHGYETNAGGFALGGPRYFAAYRDVCLRMIRDYNQNYFKFDGIGGGTMANGAPASVAPDLDALVRLLGELRRANPEVFINCTVGTWPSPYWTWFADSIWRQGEDCGFAGQGNGREQWITYRDSMIHDRFAGPSPLYPLNSLMYHGLLVGDRHLPSRMPTPAANPDSCRHEILMSVACGSGLGELYVTHKLMTPAAWDALADGIRWSRSHRTILRDTHWVGGDPKKDVYGYAAWDLQQGGTVVLRNPTAEARSFALDPQALFELPAGAPRSYRFLPALGTASTPVVVTAGQSTTLTLKPFEVLVFDATPIR